uniref:Uncharacterized protein n=1 Tax=Mycena chlorophos TaxID=658473 RepID=A0ABQ0L277_MYCCL|nr:predicted protein [Mycena chlorophos]
MTPHLSTHTSSRQGERDTNEPSSHCTGPSAFGDGAAGGLDVLSAPRVDIPTGSHRGPALPSWSLHHESEGAVACNMAAFAVVAGSNAFVASRSSCGSLAPLAIPRLPRATPLSRAIEYGDESCMVARPCRAGTASGGLRRRAWKTTRTRMPRPSSPPFWKTVPLRGLHAAKGVDDRLQGRPVVGTDAGCRPRSNTTLARSGTTFARFTTPTHPVACRASLFAPSCTDRMGCRHLGVFRANGATPPPTACTSVDAIRRLASPRPSSSCRSTSYVAHLHPATARSRSFPSIPRSFPRQLGHVDTESPAANFNRSPAASIVLRPALLQHVAITNARTDAHDTSSIPLWMASSPQGVSGHRAESTLVEDTIFCVASSTSLSCAERCWWRAPFIASYLRRRPFLPLAPARWSSAASRTRRFRPVESSPRVRRVSILRLSSSCRYLLIVFVRLYTLAL